MTTMIKIGPTWIVEAVATRLAKRQTDVLSMEVRLLGKEMNS